MRIYELLEQFDPDLDQAYEIFSQTYSQSTGASWDKNKFIQRASGWEFFGDDKGFVTVRPQRGGLYKLTGAAGSPRSILKGLQELNSKNLPIWGMVTNDIAAMLTKMGYIRPPKLVLKAILHMVPKSAFGNVPFTVNSDGSVTLQYSDVGDATKFFIANKQYYSKLSNMIDNFEQIPEALRKTIKFTITKLI